MQIFDDPAFALTNSVTTIHPFPTKHQCHFSHLTQKTVMHKLKYQLKIAPTLNSRKRNIRYKTAQCPTDGRKQSIHAHYANVCMRNDCTQTAFGILQKAFGQLAKTTVSQSRSKKRRGHAKNRLIVGGRSSPKVARVRCIRVIGGRLCKRFSRNLSPPSSRSPFKSVPCRGRN